MDPLAIEFELITVNSEAINIYEVKNKKLNRFKYLEKSIFRYYS